MLTPDTKETRICIWCRHHKQTKVTEQNPFQPHATGMKKQHSCMRFMSLITGEAEAIPCDIARQPGSPCGPQGGLFQTVQGRIIPGHPVMGLEAKDPTNLPPPKKVMPKTGGFTIHLNGFEQLFGAISEVELPTISGAPAEKSKRKRPPKPKDGDNKETA